MTGGPGWFVPRKQVPPEPSDGYVHGRAEYVTPPEDDPAPDAGDAHVRPFIVTGGRTFPPTDGLRLETLIHAYPAALSAPLAFEPRRVVEVCQRPSSVAEIAAALRLPFGVARVLVGDLLTGGLVCRLDDAPPPEHMPARTIERIRDLVRAL